MEPVTAPPLSPTDRSRVRRHRDRQRGDRAELHAVLDEALVAHLGLVVDGEPVVLPTLHARVGEVLYLHGSSGAASLRGGEPVCVTVTLLDGLVYARRWFTHSANYRSAVVRGHARRVTDPDEHLAALRSLVAAVAPGQEEYAAAPSRKELAATAVVAVDLDEASVKVRTGPPGDGDAVAEGDGRWAGVVALETRVAGVTTCPALPAGTPVPGHVPAVGDAL
ncbi:pyridoxamine 5'-phosphate oxidase family protein [Actinomycetospora chlora]|uniref:Pyridoxamine 5'-phosphate oxidase family protein n=1 Tax=Actinomycetospora chlora TaxID=663608 RepID=A0ABP9AXN3_9PSEU